MEKVNGHVLTLIVCFISNILDVHVEGSLLKNVCGVSTKSMKKTKGDKQRHVPTVAMKWKSIKDKPETRKEQLIRIANGLI